MKLFFDGAALFGFVMAASLGSQLGAAEPTVSSDSNDAAREREKTLLNDVKVPDGFAATIFAAPPAVNYPVFIAAAPDGALYVSSDQNGSLDRNLHRGSVVRLRDRDGNGRADEAKQFVSDVDTPRGLAWDHDRLYLLHPPHLSAFLDKDGDGVADEEKVLVKNIAFTFKDRPGDHSSNGIELGIDGWIYCAIGDFGFLEAEGLDGRKLQLRGGGVVRVRPDGTGLELYSRGTRNILEVAVSPLLDAFARDNTNDGGGWDIRLHHFVGLSQHGYPSLFKNFSDEIVAPLAEYGGGSGCGSLFLSEPGFPAEYNDALYTADWGRERVFRHRLTPNGATFTADQTEFVRLPRVTDLDVDASSRIYMSSWKGASYTYAGENVGFIVRVTPKGYQPDPLPNFGQAKDGELARLLESPSQRRRLEAQRELIRRGLDDETTRALTVLAHDNAKPLASRVAAVFAIKQALHEKASPILARFAKDDSIRQYVARALTDRLDELSQVPVSPILTALRDTNPRVRCEAAFSVARLGQLENAPVLASLLADADPIVAHTTVRALMALKAVDACFALLDRADTSTPEYAGALRVLRSLHEPAVVEGVLTRLRTQKDDTRRRGLLTALCRLHFREGSWKGDSWGTRPDTSGPYFQPEAWLETPRIAKALNEMLVQAPDDEGALLLTELSRHKIQTAEALNTVVALAAKNAELVPAAISQLSNSDRIPPEAIPLLKDAATRESTSSAARAQAVIALAKAGGADTLSPILSALARLPNARNADRDARLAREAFLNSPKIESQFKMLEREAAKLDETSAWADAALLALAERPNASVEPREAARKALDAGWAEPKRRAQILRAAALANHCPYAEKVLSALEDVDSAVAAAARQTATILRFGRTGPGRRNDAPVPLVGSMKTEEVVAAALKQQGDIAKRGKVERSMMPEGLVANWTMREFTSLLDYLEGLAKK